MAWPTNLARSKDWVTETLTDSDLEGQFDLIINYITDMMSSTTGHKHDATDNEGPKIATGGLDLSTITQNLVMTSKILKMAKGADVASVAGAITLGEDGNYFDITGTNAITSITAKQAGTIVILQFDSTASLVDGSNLKLNGDFAGAAESQIALACDGTNWFEIARQPNTTVASQAEMETATDILKAVTPGRAKYHPGVAKGWVNFDGTGVVGINGSLNVSSITDNGTGDYTINWTTAFSAATYALVGTVQKTGAISAGVVYINSTGALQTTSARILTLDDGGTVQDFDVVCTVAFGDQ